MGLPITPFNPQQQDILGTFSRLAQIKNAQQENRLQQQQQAENAQKLQQGAVTLQQQQDAEKDSQIWNAAQRQASGDPVKTRAYAVQSGASQSSLQSFDTSISKLQDTLSQQTSRDLTNLDKQHQNLRDEFSAVLKLPPEQQPAAYAAKVAELQADPSRAASLYGIPDVTKLPPFPGTQALQAQADGLAGQHTLVAEAKDAATTRESNAKAALDEAKKTLTANPQDLNATIDGVADPVKYADLNKRLKFQMGFAQRNLAADPDGPAKVIAAGMQEVGTTEREIDPRVRAAKLADAKLTEATKDGDPKAAARLLVDGDVAPAQLISSRKPEFAQAAFTEAKKLNPSWNAEKADADFNVAKSAANVQFFGSANSLLDKGGTLDQLVEAGKSIPAGKFPKLNSLTDWVNLSAGGSPLAGFASTALGVADDYAKVMGGGTGSDSARMQALNLIAPALNPEQRSSAINGIRNAVRSQRNSRIGNNPIMKKMYAGSEEANAGTTQPQGATHIGIGSVDKKKHYLDANGKDLGLAE